MGDMEMLTMEMLTMEMLTMEMSTMEMSTMEMLTNGNVDHGNVDQWKCRPEHTPHFWRQKWGVFCHNTSKNPFFRTFWKCYDKIHPKYTPQFS